MTSEPGSKSSRTTGAYPYAPPAAPVADAHAAAEPGKHVRPVRLLAIVGNVIFVTAPVVGFTTGRSNVGFVIVCLVFFVVGVVSLNALVARGHATWVGTLAIAANVVVGLFWTWILAVPPAGLSKGGVWVGAAYCVAAVLNIVALLVLRRTAQHTVAAARPAQTVKT